MHLFIQSLTSKFKNYPLPGKAFITICPNQHKIFTDVKKNEKRKQSQQIPKQNTNPNKLTACNTSLSQTKSSAYLQTESEAKKSQQNLHLIVGILRGERRQSAWLPYVMMGLEKKYLHEKYIGKTHPQIPRPCYMIKEFHQVLFELPSEKNPKTY